MKKLNLVLASVAALMGSAAFADTVTGTGGSFQTFALTAPNGTPYWNNVSGATVNGSNQANIGDFLSDSGAYALNGNVTPNCPTTDCGVTYEAPSGPSGNMFVGAGNAQPSSFNFVRQAGALNISLLYANSAASSLVEFGIYDASSLANAQNNHTILQSSGTNLANLDGHSYDPNASYTQFTAGPTLQPSVTLANGSPYASWGIYVRLCVTPASFQGTVCNGGANNVVTYFFNPSYDQNVGADPASHEHFALFQAASNANQYYLGLEDYNGIGGEGQGDYKDLILSINTSAGLGVQATPEPTTFVAMGLGLAGLGLLRKRMVKK